MSETGEYCIRCSGITGLSLCRDCVIEELGFTASDVTFLRACADFGTNFETDNSDGPKLTAIAAKIAKALER